MPSVQSFADLRAALAIERTALLEHALYQRLASLDDLRTFMEHHVFAVWDFMSLLKSLQAKLTCVDVPWVPRATAEARRLVNEIVLVEESDEGADGRYVSHFEMYRSAMQDAGCDGSRIDEFVVRVARGESVQNALMAAHAPAPAGEFVLSTFETIEAHSLPRLAASFTVGREDVIPDMFHRLVEGLDRDAGGCLGGFRHYLVRHIDVDGERHGPMTVRLLESLCGHDSEAWTEALAGARAALRARRTLWDGIAAGVGLRTAAGATG
jgi:hypothetical protein